MESTMGEYESLVSIALALAVGLLIGFEREQSAPGGGRHRSFVGGARTYPLVALAGAFGAMLARPFGVALLVITFAGLCGFLLVGYLDSVRREHDHGLTSEVAFLVTFLLGAIAASHGLIEPVSRRVLLLLGVAVVITVFLSLKPRLHELLHHATQQDVYATLKFLMVALVVLPLLPREPVASLDGVTPFKIGLMVAMIAGMGFVGYVLARAMGPGRGLVVTGLVGGLVSSTAVTLSSAARARETPALAGACALAVVSASAIMFFRVLAVVAVVYPPLAGPLAIPMGLMGIAAGTTSLLVWRHTRPPSSDGQGPVALRNPFELSQALKFGFLFTVVLVISNIATQKFGASGSYVTGVLAGSTDMDAIAISMAELNRGGLDTKVAATAIILGTGSNTVVKGALSALLGGWAFGRRVLLSFGVTLLSGAAGLGAVWLWT